jgi:hypothetical protein
MKFLQQKFFEEQKIPSDTTIIDKTWAKVNKNGTADSNQILSLPQINLPIDSLICIPLV